MPVLYSSIRRVVLFLALLLMAGFLVVVVNQTAQVVQLAATAHPVLGTAVLWGLLILYGICLVVPAALLIRLPKPLKPPESEDSPEFEAHLRELGRRLESNPSLHGRPVRSREEIEAALSTLDRRADEVVKAAASQAFVTTAVSQNGALDTLLVLATQSRLVWKIAHVYYQRPSIRDLVYLYGNVTATALIAGELEDMDLSEQLQPVIAAALGSTVSAVPGFHAASSIFVNSVLTGAANAFLTLRVGVIAKSYSSALVVPDRRALRRSAVATAAAMLGSIAVDGSRKISAAFWKASGGKVGRALRELGSQVKGAGSSLAGKMRFPRAGDEPEPQEG
jgi:hypothetical protein